MKIYKQYRGKGFLFREILKKTMEYLTTVNDGKKHEFNRKVVALKEEQTKIQGKLDKMIDLLADGILTKKNASTN